MAEITNVNDAIEQIVCSILIKDEEYQNIKDDKAKRKEIYDKRKTEVSDAIRNICSIVEKKLPEGIPLPEDIYVKVANKLLNEVKNNPSAIHEVSNLDPKTIMTEFRIPAKTMNEQESKNNQLDSAGIVIAAAMAGKVLTKEMLSKAVDESLETGIVHMGNGVDLTYIEPSDSKYDFENEQAKREDYEITTLVGYIEELMSKAGNDPVKIKKAINSIRETIKNSEFQIGADAILTYLSDYTSLDTPEKLAGNVALMDLMVEERNRVDSNFRPDNYTTINDVIVADKIFKLDDSNPQKQHLLEQMKAMNPKVYSLIETYPTLWEELRKQYGVDVAIEMFGDSVPRTIEETYSKIEEFIRERNIPERIQEVINIEEQEDRQDKEEHSVEKTKISPEQKAENYRNMLMKMVKVKGVSYTLKFANNNITKSSILDRELLTAVVADVVSQQEFLQEAKQEDISTIKELIGGCLDEQNKKQNSQLIEYVQALGGAVKEISERTAEKTIIEEVVEEVTQPIDNRRSTIEFDDEGR